MTRGLYNPNEKTLPRPREKAPDGLGTQFLWTGKREHSKTDALSRLLMPKEYERVEKLRRMKREQILGPMAGGGAGLVAGAAVLEAFDEAGTEGVEAAAAEEEEEEEEEGEEDADQAGNAEENAGRPGGDENDSSSEVPNDDGDEAPINTPKPEAAPASDTAANVEEAPALEATPDAAPASRPSPAVSTHSNPRSPSAHPPALTTHDQSPPSALLQEQPPTEVAEHRSSYPLLPPSQVDPPEPAAWFRLQEQTYQWPLPSAPVTVQHASFPDPWMQHCYHYHYWDGFVYQQPGVYGWGSSYTGYEWGLV